MLVYRPNTFCGREILCGRDKRKTHAILRAFVISGGGSRIRTHGRVNVNSFQDCRLQPLGHASAWGLRVCAAFRISCSQSQCDKKLTARRTKPHRSSVSAARKRPLRFRLIPRWLRSRGFQLRRRLRLSCRRRVPE